ncbi:MAG: hypothetical protein HY736_08520 [Verrucomicrobia bacterium]|nr:hypothetical protein [Verrucomicrobiota bacterium]
MHYPSHFPATLAALILLAAAVCPPALAQGSDTPLGDFRPRPVVRVPIFFPPIPPALDRPVARGVVLPGRLNAPDELAPFVNEPFYPPLSTRLATKSLNDKLRRQLEQYRAAKVALQAELRTEFDRQRDADPAARQQALEALARTQTPKIAQLEQTAEQLRQDLIVGSQTWSALREWHLGDKDRRGFSPGEIAAVMRSYSYYQNGLLPAQRRLLREIMMELLSAVDDAAKASAAQPFLFFSPEPARVLLPDDLSADLSAKVAEYQTGKSQLKKELYDAIHAYDGGALGGFLNNSLKTLARKQAPAFAALDALAEDIRRGLARSPPAARPAERSTLPPVLANRLSVLLRDRATTQRDAVVKADAISGQRQFAPVRVSYRFDDDGMKFVVIPARGPRTPPFKEEVQVLEKVRAELGAVAAEYGRRMAEHVNEWNGIRRDAAEVLGSTKPEVVDAALATAHRLALQKENEAAFRDYRVAVFEPGLSLEQRRLLFDAALERLDLPLPRGELQPTRRGSSW